MEDENNNNSKSSVYSQIRDKMKIELSQFVNINTTLEETTEGIDTVSKKSSDYQSQIAKSKNHVDNLIKKHRKEKYFLYFCLWFYIACMSIVLIRRMPLMLLLKWLISLFEYVINIVIGGISYIYYNFNYTKDNLGELYSNSNINKLNDDINSSDVIYINKTKDDGYYTDLNFGIDRYDSIEKEKIKLKQEYLNDSTLIDNISNNTNYTDYSSSNVNEENEESIINIIDHSNEEVKEEIIIYSNKSKEYKDYKRKDKDIIKYNNSKTSNKKSKQDDL